MNANEEDQDEIDTEKKSKLKKVFNKNFETSLGWPITKGLVLVENNRFLIDEKSSELFLDNFHQKLGHPGIRKIYYILVPCFKIKNLKKDWGIKLNVIGNAKNARVLVKNVGN